MSSRLNRMWLMPFLLLASQAGALGLGEIRLSSALNEPLRAQIELLSATPEEIRNLTIGLASAETFDRYDLDRPRFLTRIRFEIIESGRVDGNIIRVTSLDPVSEPFVTFLVEAAWTRGRLLREYTLLLDPPTFAPPPVSQATESVTAPSRSAPTDAGRIQRRPAPQQQAAPPPVQPRQVQPASSLAAADEPAATREPGRTAGEFEFDAAPGGDLVVQRGETLWGITSRVRPDSRLTMNQTMLAIYEANPEAFDANVNVMRAGAVLRIPSADDVFRIGRGDALAEVQRQHAAWDGVPGILSGESQSTLTLVPPDEEDEIGLTDENAGSSGADALADQLPDDLFNTTEDRLSELEGIFADQDALIAIPDNELAALRAELAELRGEEPPVEVVTDDAADDLLADDASTDPVESGVGDDGIFVDDEVFVGDEVFVDDESTDVADTAVADPAVPQVVARPVQDEGIVDIVLGYVTPILGYVTNFWVGIGAALLTTVAILFWFMRRAAGGDDEDMTGVWDALDSDELGGDSVSSTDRLRALAVEDDQSIVVVETGHAPETEDDIFSADTMGSPVLAGPEEQPVPTNPLAETGANRSLDDTFSSETAINLDQSDPVSEADFHMAYGLYDQAADLINGALDADPGREDLLAKLCEIYFVWGNRDAFTEAAGRLKSTIGSGPNSDWDKIVIMGQQIAGDHEMFSGVSAGGATKAVDLSFDEGMEDAGALDIDFAGGPDGSASDVIDLGADTGQVPIAPDTHADIDFSFDEPNVETPLTMEMPEPTEESPTIESMPGDETEIMPSFDLTAEPPTVEDRFEVEATGELPAISDMEIALPGADATAEIDLDDLGLDLGDLEETALASNIAYEDQIGALEDTAANESLKIGDDLAETGKNLAFGGDDLLSITGKNEDLSDLEATGQNPAIDFDFESGEIGAGEGQSATTEMPSFDEETAMSSALSDDGDDTGFGLDTDLLDATGQTHVLTKNMVVETAADDEENDDEYDFVKTEAMGNGAFGPDLSTDETGRMPALAGSTDMDLDLDDLTAALKVSEVGDTINAMRDEATAEQPGIRPESASGGNSAGEMSGTHSLTPEDLSGDLDDARTMTEVGTKLDLARAYVDMGDPSGARSILEEVLDEGDEAQKQQAQQLLDTLPG